MIISNGHINTINKSIPRALTALLQYPRRTTKSFLVRRKSPTSVWRRLMSSTRKMPDRHRSPKN
jgi:hypothetical protein